MAGELTGAPPGVAGPTGGSPSVSGKARVSPPGVRGPTDQPIGLDLAPDVFSAWRAFTDALGTHLPHRLTSAQTIGRAMRGAVK